MNVNSKNRAVSWLFVLVLLAGCNGGGENKESHAPANPNSAVHQGHGHTTAEEEYTCPMHPQIVQNKPGTCPICGMDLVKKVHAGGDSLPLNADLEALLQPTNSVVIANIATVQPQRRSQAVTVQANGIITYDTRRLFTIPARYSGRIEKLYVRYQYQPIRKGQKLLELYSPELITAQRELLYLLSDDQGNAPLIASARQKLRLLGVTDAQLADLQRTRQPSYSLAIYSPYDGYIVEESANVPSATTPTGTGMANSRSSMGAGSGMGDDGNTAGTDELTFAPPTPLTGGGAIGGSLLLREGQYVQTGQRLFRVVNPGRLWAEFRLYAQDAAGIKPGDALTISFDQTNLSPRPARVSLVVPFLENGTSFVTLRAYLPGSNTLRVGQLIRAQIRKGTTEGLWLPATAVLDLGNEQVAFVRQPSTNAFRPVRVQVGSQSEGYVVIRSGLNEAQAVAQNAQFLIDSESFVNLTKAGPRSATP